MIRIGWLNIDRGGDDSYYNIEAAGWSIGELACAMAVTCLPTLRPLFFKMRPGGSGSNDKGWMGSSAPPTIGGSGEKRAGSSSDSSYTNRSWLADSEKGFDDMSLEFETTPSSFSDSWNDGAVPPFPSVVQRPTRPMLLKGTGYTTTKVSSGPRQAPRYGWQATRNVSQKGRRTCTCTCHCGLR